MVGRSLGLFMVCCYILNVFSKMLRKHKADLIEKNAHKIAENPSKLRKKFELPYEYICANNIPESEWINCYKHELFVLPILPLNQNLKKML